MTVQNPLIAGMLKGLIPMLFAQVGKISMDDKRKFAGFIADACKCFIEDDREQFDQLLSIAQIDETWKESLTNALWNGD